MITIDLKKEIIFTCVVCILCISTAAFGQKQNEWKKVKDKEGIQVYIRSSKLTSVKEVRIVTEFNTSLTQLKSILKDVTTYPNWVYKCKSTKHLKTINESEFLYYSVSDLPVPIRDRDVVAHSRQWWDEENQTHNIESVAYKDFMQKQKGMVRIPLLISRWKLMPISDNKVKVDYCLLMEPGGSIPGWLVNMAIKKGPTKTMQRLDAFISSQ